MTDWLIISISLILIVSGTALLSSCLSQRNYELTHMKCPECNCEFEENYQYEEVGTFH